MGMGKADRLLHILNLLRSRRNLNAANLAEDCGVTERSIYRDIISLSEANIPIYYDRGYKMASGNFLPPLNLTLEEYQCLRLSLESTPLRISPLHKKIVKSVQAKIEAGLSDKVNQERRSTPQNTVIEIASTQEEKKAQLFYPIIEDALNNNRCLELEYVSIETGPSKRVVEPQFIIFRGRAFYFVAYCRLRKSLRTFRMDRIQRVRLSNEHSRRVMSVKPQDYFEGSWEVFKGEPVKVMIRFSGFSAKIVASSHHHDKEQVEKLSDDQLIYTVTVNGLIEIKRWIRGFGEEAEVLEPKELRDDFRRLGNQLTETYKFKSQPPFS